MGTLTTAKIDNNYKKVLSAVTDDATAEVRSLLVDATTGRLKCTAVLGAGAGITELNGLTEASQRFGTASTGNDFTILSSGSSHTFYLPTASATVRGALGTANWTTFNDKQGLLGFSSPITKTGTLVAIPAATSAGSGILTNTDWTTFNNKLSAFGTLNSGSIEVLKLSGVANQTLDDYIRYANSAGRIQGGALTSNGTNEIAISAGTGFCRISADNTAPYRLVTWGTGTLALTGGTLTTNYVYIDYNSGTPIPAITSNRLAINKNSQFVLGATTTDGVENAHVVTTGMNLTNWTTNDHSRLVELRRVERASGADISNTGTTSIASTSGIMYVAGVRQSLGARDTSAGSTFTSVYRDGSNSWKFEYNRQVINNQGYDNNLGTITALTVNKYGVHWIYVLYDGELYSLYGQGDYSLADAQTATRPASIPTELTDFGILAAKVIIQKSAATFTSVISAYTTQFATSPVVDHNSLTGLQGGETAQYYHLTASKYGSIQSLVFQPNTVGYQISGGTTSYTWQVDGSGSTSNTVQNVTLPLTRTGTTIAIPAATSAGSGVLTNTDWTTFNDKQGLLGVTSPVTKSGTLIALAGLTSLGTTGYMVATGGANWTYRALASGTNMTVNWGTGTVDVGMNNSIVVPGTVSTTNFASTGTVKIGTLGYYASEYPNGALGKGTSINWQLGNKQSLTLDNGTITMATHPHGPCNLVLKMTQPATGTAAVNWETKANIFWSGSNGSLVGTVASRTYVASFYYDGTNYYGILSNQFTP